MMLGAQEPVVPVVPPIVPVTPPVAPPALPPGTAPTGTSAPLQTIITSAEVWRAEATAGPEGTVLWSNGSSYPYSGSKRGWNSHELLSVGPAGISADLTGPGSQKASLMMESGAQGWWRATAGNTGALEIRLPAGNLHLSYRGDRQSRGYLTARDLMIAFPTASLTLLQYGTGDFLLICHSGWADIKSGTYRFRMGNQRAYERIGSEVRYFEVPAKDARQVIRDWRQAADRRAASGRMPELPPTEIQNLEQQYTNLRGWGAELQYWHNRLASPTALSATERTNALDRLETPAAAWEASLAKLEQTAGRLDQSAAALEKASPAARRVLKPWQDRRTRWQNLLSQLRFALGLHSRLSAPLPQVQTVTPPTTASGTSAGAQGANAQQLQNLQDLTDPKRLLQGLLEGM